MASSHKPRPRMSLPPELNDIDDAWGEEEQPTIARPSRIPTSPIRESLPDEIPTAPGAPIDIELAEEGEDIQDRVTAVPEVPLDDYAKRVMTSTAQEAATEAPPPKLRPSSPEEMALGIDASSPRDMGRRSETPTQSPSELPTAPPPQGFDEIASERMRTMPRPSSVDNFTLDPAISETDPPPAISERLDQPAFSGRFSSAPPVGNSQHQAMKDKFAMGDFSGALEVAEGILKETPSDVEAESLASKCREVLQDMYASRIAGMEKVPSVAMSPDQIRWLSLDHRAGFMLSMIDGISSVDDLLDVSGMQRLDALRIICSLLDQKVITLS